MSAKIYLNLLFLCCILYQGIFATLSDKDTSLSSNFLVRRRRVINRMPGGRAATRIEDVNYMVKIKEGPRSICAGAILSHDTVITAAICVGQDVSNYQVQSGSAGYTGQILHNVTSKAINLGHPPHHWFDGIALITVHPSFVYTAKTGNIRLYQEPILRHALVTIPGWGYLYPPERGMETRQRLRTIHLPVMSVEECRIVYHGRFNITEKYICTYHPQQHCARDDEGAPLIINNRLAGIHIYKGQREDQRNPDVFINLQHPDYREYIREHFPLI